MQRGCNKDERMMQQGIEEDAMRTQGRLKMDGNKMEMNDSNDSQSLILGQVNSLSWTLTNGELM